MPSVIIPAHNEGRVIGRLLSGLVSEADTSDLEVIVVSNGSIDDTADVARRYQGIEVIELPQSSKHLALEAGDKAARGYPRLYVDADIEIDLASVHELIAALDEAGTLAVAPERVLDLNGSSWPVRAHYRVWEQLPVVRKGLFGRGVVGVSEVGYQRIAGRPSLLGDDLYVHSCFAASERRIVSSARAVVRGPRTVSDLLRRRTRSAHGNAELGDSSGGATRTTSATIRQVIDLARTQPRMWPSIAVFSAITVVGRLRGRQMRASGTTEWLRDESSRA